MAEAQMIGLIIGAVVLIGSFVALVVKILNKFTEPINELRIVIQRLDDTLRNLTSDIESIRRRVEHHGEEIDKITLDLHALTTKVSMYHQNK